MTLAYNSVPVIDVAPYLGGGAEQKMQVARQIRHACEEIGFFSIVGHGIPAEAFEKLREEVMAFFALPEDERAKVRQPPSGVSRGYSSYANRALAYSMGDVTPPDLQLSYAMGPVDPCPVSAIGTHAEAAFFHPNIWPEQPSGLRFAFEAYYRHMEKLAHQVLRMFAMALGLDEYHFDGMLRHPTSAMRAILYPAQHTPPEPGQLRAGAHTDYGTLTVLRGDDVPGGLQVRIRDGRWIDVHPEPDAFICNIGDLMMRWTNDRWLSNMHRVANPPPEHAHAQRLSVAFFHNPDFDAEIRCIDPGAEALYAPIEFGEYYLSKHLKAQHMNAAVAAALSTKSQPRSSSNVQT